MIQRKGKTNQRLIDMIRVKYAHQEGIRIGFNRFNQSDDEKLENMRDTFQISVNDLRKDEFSQQISRSQSELVDNTDYSFSNNNTDQKHNLPSLYEEKKVSKQDIELW